MVFMINLIWGSFILIGIGYALLTGRVDVINQEIIECGNSVVELFMGMFPLMILWSGIMNIAKKAEILDHLAKMMRPLFRLIFPELKADDPALGYIASNLTINMLGIHNASTPFGLKAMKCLQEKNPDKKVATRSMITFLVLNTSGVTLIATDIIGVRTKLGATSPTDLVMVTIIATIVNTILALFVDRLLWKRWRNRELKRT